MKLSICEPNDPDSRGYVGVAVGGKPDLHLTKWFDRYGGGATIDVAVQKGSGLYKGRWICGSVDLFNREHLVIRDPNGNAMFRELLPSA